jgi:hypothetical protein
MEIIGILEERKKDILDKWFQNVADTYPEKTTRFLRNKADRFANPVGHAVRQGLQGLLNGLLSGAGEDELAPHLDEIVRIRAVQEFSPSEAVQFIFSLKNIVGETCGAGGAQAFTEEFAEFDSRIDGLALLAFDNYMSCRETLFEIKVKELRDMVSIQTRNMWKAAAGEGGGTVSNKEPPGGQ